MVLFRRDESRWNPHRAAARGGLILAILLAAACATSGKEYGREKRHEVENKSHPNPNHRLIAAATVAPKPSIYSYSCAYPRDAEQANLCIERQGAESADKWGGRTFWVGLASAVGLFLTLLATAWAAFAASRSAKAAEAVVAHAKDSDRRIERAYIYPVIVATGPLNELIQMTRVYYLEDGGEKLDTQVPETGEITFRLKNFGKTPAVIKWFCANFCVVPMGSKSGFSIPESILGPGEETSDMTKEMDIGMTPREAGRILAYEASLGFDGLVKFDDIWGVEHTTEFIFTWDKDIQKMVLRDMRNSESKKN